MSDAPGRSGLVDLHSHLVPGVDDGSTSVDDVLEGVGRMVDAGISRVVTTPHLPASRTLDPDGFDRWMEEVDGAYAETAAALRDRFPEFRFGRGHEVRLDHPEPDLSDPRVRLGAGNFVLVEWAAFQAPPGAARVLERLGEQGVRVLLAHPERYRRPLPSLARLAAWREAGAAFQVNYGSLFGQYGSDARERAFELLARGWVDCLATDFHGRPHLPLHVSEARTLLADRDGDGDGAHGLFELLAGTNPARILRGDAPLPVPGWERSTRLWSRVVSLFR